MRIRKMMAATFAILMIGGDIMPSAAAVVKVPAGTSILLKTLKDVTEDQGVGDIIPMSVDQDVMVNGQVVIKAGATGQAELVTVQKHGFFGIPTKIVMVSRRVNTVDGNAIQIANTKTLEGNNRIMCSIVGTILCLFPAFITGGTAKLASGALMDAVTTAPAEVTTP